MAGNMTTVTTHYTVVYTWNGFFSPITNTRTSQLNLVHAGDLIKLGFGLNGDRGLNIFAPAPDLGVDRVPGLDAALGPGRAARARPRASASAASGHYTYGWQTSAGWAGTCRQFQLQLNDGTATVTPPSSCSSRSIRGGPGAGPAPRFHAVA